jgi:hypothetical protein
VAVAMSLGGGVTPSGASALGAALLAGVDASSGPQQFTSYLLDTLAARAKERPSPGSPLHVWYE